jgi:microcystin-dependent protein
MSQPFLAEIRIVGFNFAPRGWASCDGQLLSISQNTALFSLLGTTYGGDGRVTFGLPNFKGSAPMQQGQGPGLTDRVLGEIGGEANVTVQTQQMPGHNHQVQAGAAGGRGGGTNVPTGNDLGGGAAGTDNIYGPSSGSNVPMSPQGFAITGGNQPHNNMAPYLCLFFVIAMQGIFPPRG